MELNKDSYYALLNSPLWKRFRLDVIKKKGYKCEKCGRVLKRGLCVHHRRYRAGKKPWEYPMSDLQRLCAKCHSETHINLLKRGKRILVWDSNGKETIDIPMEKRCKHCGGTGFKEDFQYLMGGLCFYCFGTGIRNIHYYSRLEARFYSYKIYNQWLAHHEDDEGNVDSEKFSSRSNVEDWLLSINNLQ